MVISQKKTQETRDYIQKLFSIHTEEEFLQTALPEAARILNIDYHAFILFPNVFTEKIMHESNNPENFTKEYASHLIEYDHLLSRMIEGGNKTTAVSEVMTLKERRKDLFFNECDALRPAGDGVYIPLIVDNMLAGFIGMVRAKDNARRLSREELTLLEFLLSFFPDAITRILDIKSHDAQTAILDYHGTVLTCGDELRGRLQNLAGTADWRYTRNLVWNAETPIARAMNRILENPGSTQMIGGAGTAYDELRLQLRLIHPHRIRRYFPDQPQFELKIAKAPGPPFRSELIDTFSLTEREVEIVMELYHGKSNNSIACDLGISLGTVKQHIYNIYNKTGVDSRVQLILKLST